MTNVISKKINERAVFKLWFIMKYNRIGKRYIKLGFYAILFIIGMSACNHNERYKETIQKMTSKPVNLSKDKMELVYCNTKDSTMQSDMDETKGYLWVVYADSFVCSSCKLSELHYWNEFIYESKKKFGNVDFRFIFSPKKEDENIFMFTVRSLKFATSIYLDTSNSFHHNNPQIPKDQRFHTFLLNGDKEILLVGDPVKNEKINELFQEIVADNKR